METTPSGTSVGVDDPYEYVDRCDHLTSDGRCRFAVEHRERDPEFAHEREREDLRCPVGDAWDWCDCPHFRARNRSRACVRCGLVGVRMAHTDERPLLETHHLSYATDADEAELTHEITVTLCRWCHAKVHNSWARIDDDASPDPDALAVRATRCAREQDEFGFQTAAERREE